MRCLVTTILIVFCSCVSSATEVKVATYNIKFLDAEKIDNQGNRRSKLKEIIKDIGADVWALQEIDDRAALKKIFSTNEWNLIIDQDSGNAQDVALAVRKTLALHNVNADMDADDKNFLFSGSENNNFFPSRRDALAVDISVPGQNNSKFTVIVMHTKARVGGRTTTEPRRVGASIELIKKIEQEYDGKRVIVLGDFNDTFDDRSLNILETGDASATAKMETDIGTFLVNLTEPLGAQGHVTFGRNSSDIDGDALDVIDPDARYRNFLNLGNDKHTGDQMFDQILVTPELFNEYIDASITIYDNALAARGNNKSRASDHLPVFASFMIGKEAGNIHTSDVKISSALPNPEGQDKGKEIITLSNLTNSEISLSGWSVQDKASNRKSLDGHVLPAGGSKEIKLIGTAMLNNSGDTLHLINANGQIVHTVSYQSSEVVLGEMVSFN